MASYHESATTSVAFNPYLPAIGRVLEVLRSYGPNGTTIEINNRDLASAASCSAGRIPALLRTLEADGMIERATGTRGSLLVVLERSTMVDRSEIDQDVDRMEMRYSSDQDVDRPIVTVLPDRSESVEQSDQHVDPPCIPNKVLSMSDQQQQLVRGREALWDALRAANAAPIVALDILEKNPELTLAAFESLRRGAQSRGSHKSEKSIGLVFWCLQNNQPLHSAKESTNASPARRRPTPNHVQRSAVPQPAALQPGDLARFPKRGAVPGVSG